MIEDATTEPRALEILDSAKSIFASKGFDGASMQDLARAAGMSAGNFYRYFPSKDAIVEAIIARELTIVLDKFAEVIRDPDPRGAFRAMVREHVESPVSADDCLWAEIEAAAGRRPKFAALLRHMEDEIVRSLTGVLARIADAPAQVAAKRYAAHARLLVLLVQGVAMRSVLQPGGPGADEARDLASLVVRMIDHTLADVAADARPATGGHGAPVAASSGA